jgi:methylisocitrate lyase
MPGVFNALSARCATDAGAAALYLSGGALTNANLGVPDIALATLTEFAQQAAFVTAVTGLPVLSDADTGFGEANNTRRTVIELERAGLAGIHLEDQTSPKRCGHLEGKTLIPTDHMQEKIRAAVAAKSDPDFFIMARTDARHVEGLDGAIERANAYRKSGADGIFPEGLTSRDEFAAFRDSVDGPLLANMTEFGQTPFLSVSEFSDLGYQLVIFPVTVMRGVLKTMDELYTELVTTGTQREMMDRLRTRGELYERLEYSRYGDVGYHGV